MTTMPATAPPSPPQGAATTDPRRRLDVVETPFLGPGPRRYGHLVIITGVRCGARMPDSSQCTACRQDDHDDCADKGGPPKFCLCGCH